MRKKDEGAIHKLFALFLMMWAVIGSGVLMSVMHAGYVNRYLQDCLMQANLAAMLIDPYHYGSTGELVFADVEETRQIFERTLKKSIGAAEAQKQLGLRGEAQLLELRLYEVTVEGTSEFVFDENGQLRQKKFPPEETVSAPDGTTIQNSAVYARISVPVEFLLGVRVTAVKEHCVDVVSEERGYEQ